ncbi:MAG TPA: AraC family transcriptional regulator [Bacteroidales bacterium]|jgi:AraC-like DNA-binding protein|nr:AraC family transcriptional regulator [Bacteroidales bacterium]
MDEILKLDTVSQFNTLRGIETLHPLVSVIDFSKMKLIPRARANYGFYCVFLKDAVCGDLKYGCKTYDYQEGTLVFFAPGQVVGIGNVPGGPLPKGWGLIFHPDLIRGTSLGQSIKKYTFFSYDTTEALHISERERQTVMDCLDKIDHELRQSIDKHSKTLIGNNIELLLNYCMRFYDRQFITRSDANRDILAKFEQLLDNYFQSDIIHTEGLPTVKYCADQLHLSPNYFGDLIKKETGKSALDNIQQKVMSIAKERIFDRSKTLSEIAYELGFKHPQHFSRMFKNETGQTPNEYRSLN